MSQLAELLAAQDVLAALQSAVKRRNAARSVYSHMAMRSEGESSKGRAKGHKSSPTTNSSSQRRIGRSALDVNTKPDQPTGRLP